MFENGYMNPNGALEWAIFFGAIFLFDGIMAFLIVLWFIKRFLSK